jgi:hypothetical protein
VRVDAEGIKAADVKVGSLDLPVSRSPKALSGLLQGACQFWFFDVIFFIHTQKPRNPGLFWDCCFGLPMLL